MCEKTTNSNVSDEPESFKLSEWLKHLAFDMDENGFPKLTEINVALIEFIIHNDSNYRALGDSNSDSINKTIIAYYNPDDSQKIKKIVDVIDKQNSTHLASMGRGHKGENDGRIRTAEYIATIHDFSKRLKERDFELVNDIALKSIPPSQNFKGRYVFSFASKYCTYTARTIFKGTKEADNFSIFDDVICKILPYYAWTYLGDDSFCRTKSKKRRTNEEQSSSFEIERISTIKERFGSKNKGDYRGYCELIDRIRDSAIKKYKDDQPISRKGFDHLLWYYFKGGAKGGNSRISKALKCVGESSKRLI